MKEKIKEELTDGLLRELGDRWNNARIRCTRSVEGVEGETEGEAYRYYYRYASTEQVEDKSDRPLNGGVKIVVNRQGAYRMNLSTGKVERLGDFGKKNVYPGDGSTITVWVFKYYPEIAP